MVEETRKIFPSVHQIVPGLAGDRQEDFDLVCDGSRSATQVPVSIYTRSDRLNNHLRAVRDLETVVNP